MKRVAPPGWLQSGLHLLLSVRDRETVVGDLYEEFCEQKAPKLGSFRACLWYARQVFSFAAIRFASAFVQQRALLGLCFFTCMAGTWLGGMDLYLHHPGYARREFIAAIITGQALVTLTALRVRSLAFLKPLAMAGCLPIVWLAGGAILGTFRGSHPEGYVLVIALALLLQALLTWWTLPAAEGATELKA